MGLIEIFTMLYLMIAGFAIIMTYREQRQKGMKSPLFNMIGFCLCIVWPVVVGVLLHLKSRQQPA